MTTFDRYAIVFILAFLAANILWGVKSYYRELEIEELITSMDLIVFEAIEKRNCYKLKAQEHTIGIRRRTC